MGKYSIKDLERLSGIKAHTIRIWEQRYEIIVPDRTDTNIRTYSDEDLRKILNISLLNKNGYKISNIAQMTNEQLQREVLSITENVSDHSNQINALTIAMVEMDEDRFEKIISTNILRLGFEKTMVQIIYPFMHRIGVMWQTGAINPAQEHFISNLIRQKLLVAIDGQGNVKNNEAKKFILYCPEGELHELALLFANYILRSRKFKVIYLGISVPFADIQSVYEIHQPDYFFTVLTTKPAMFETQEYIDLLAKKFPNTSIFISGQELINNEYHIPKNIKQIKQIEQLLQLLDEIQKPVFAKNNSLN